ncbi:MAG: type II toxin-antitoxin system VapC family toxin [Egibacteraceae bacterium]
MILLDTHVVLWWQAGGDRLSRRAARELAKADAILISPISCWEVATLLAKGRIGLDRDIYTWIRDLFNVERITSASLSPQAAVGAALLGQKGFHGDPADRFLYATARELSVPLMTKDEQIREFADRSGDLQTVW